jgi:hypothetical protein
VQVDGVRDDFSFVDDTPRPQALYHQFTATAIQIAFSNVAATADRISQSTQRMIFRIDADTGGAEADLTPETRIYGEGAYDLKEP